MARPTTFRATLSAITRRRRASHVGGIALAIRRWPHPRIACVLGDGTRCAGLDIQTMSTGQGAEQRT